MQVKRGGELKALVRQFAAVRRPQRRTETPGQKGWRTESPGQATGELKPQVRRGAPVRAFPQVSAVRQFAPPPIGGGARELGELTDCSGGGELKRRTGNGSQPPVANRAYDGLVSTTARTPGNVYTTMRWSRAVNEVTFRVNGAPAPQGSKSFKGIRNGKAVLTEASKRVTPWRAEITEAATAAWGERPPLDGPVAVSLEFIMPRPLALANSKPTPPATKRNGDLDKLARAALDAASGVCYADDAQVTWMACSKRTADAGEEPGLKFQVGAILW